jgi:hypothetical protein
MAISPRMKQRIDNLTGIYLNALEQHQAGWNRGTPLGALQDYRGAPPPRATSHKPDDSMIHAIGQIRSNHAKLPLAVFMLGKFRICTRCGSGGCDHCSNLGFTLDGGQLKPELALSLLASIYYNTLSRQQIADQLGLNLRQYENRLVRARERVAQELEWVDRLSSLLAVPDCACIDH